MLDIGICVVAFLIFSYTFGWRFSTLFEPTVPLPRPGAGNSDADAVAAER